MQKRFPKFVGSSTGLTQLDAVDVDSSFNVVFAGRSNDSSMVANPNSTPCLVGYLPQSSFDYKWAKELNVYNQDVISLQFKPNGSSLLILYTNPIIIVIMDSSNGSVLASIKDSTN